MPFGLGSPGGSVASFVFLSDEWFDAVGRLIEERDIELPAGATLRMNVVVTETPFGDDRRLHFDTGEGEPVWGHGHLDVVDLTLTTDYGTAREIFVGADLQSAMQALFEGRVKIQGDLTKLMAAQAAGAGPAAPGLAQALAEITE
jgi:hypothetical protein